jgi:hypothetical protein
MSLPLLASREQPSTATSPSPPVAPTMAVADASLRHMARLHLATYTRYAAAVDQ